MKIKKAHTLLAGFCALSLAHSAPVQLIFDTDMGNDVDDALALAMVHSLQSLGECKLLAVTTNKDNPYSPLLVDVINTFYGRGDIPIGAVKNSGVTPEDGRFAKQVCERVDGDGNFIYARTHKTGDVFPEASALLRKTLAQAEDNSVVFIVIGFSTNMARLLASPPDDISPLDGKALLAKKGKFVSIMAANFSPKKTLEYNVQKDPPSAEAFYRDCPIPMVFSSYEIGESVPYPWSSIQKDYKWAKDNPVVESYKLYEKGPHDRPTWDLCSVLYAVRPERADYYSLSKPGTVALTDARGHTAFKPSADGKHRLMQMSAAQKRQTLKALVELSSRPRDKTPVQK